MFSVILYMLRLLTIALASSHLTVTFPKLFRTLFSVTSENIGVATARSFKPYPLQLLSGFFCHKNLCKLLEDGKNLDRRK
jgi:hypothetical protein